MYILFILVFFINLDISLTVMFVIEESLEEVMLHDFIVSQRAILFLNKKSFFSSIVFGIFSLKIIARTFQNLF